MAVRVIAIVLAALSVSDAAQVGSPIQKVLQMMGDMKAKALKEKQNEIVMMTKFEAWCKNTDASKTKAVQDGKEQAEQLAADIETYDSDAKVLSEEIAKLDESLDLAAKDKESATKLRKKEHADYQKTHAEYVENIADLGAALKKIKDMMAASPGASAASLLQELSSRSDMSAHSRHFLTAFIAERSSEDLAIADGEEMQAPEAAVFESQSGGIVDMMETLESKLVDEKSQLEKEEMNKKSAYNMMVQSLDDAISQQTQSRGNKLSAKKQAEEGSARAKGDLSDTKNTLAEDTKYLNDLKTMCTTKMQEFGIAQKVRAEELEALDEAIEIISSGSVAGAGAEHLGLAQRQTALMQLRSSHTQRMPKQERAASFLEAQGKKLGSKILAAVAVHTGSDPFAKVTKMIKGMIQKLMEEANEEATHKGFCDTEMGTNKQTREQKSTDVAKLKASIEEMTAEAEKMATEVADLSDQITAIDDSVASATSDRNDEKAKNTATIKDAKEAKAAVSKALAVLKTFYDKAANPVPPPAAQEGPIKYDDRAIAILSRPGASLVQGPMDDAPGSVSKPFTGTGDAGGGIMGMLEVIISDFEKLDMETSEEEMSAAKEYDSFMADSSEDKAVKETDIKHKSNRKQRLESDTATAKRDLKSTQDELDAALAYYEKLKPDCEVKVVSYEEKVAQRKAEIESLQEALEILSGDNI